MTRGRLFITGLLAIGAFVGSASTASAIQLSYTFDGGSAQGWQVANMRGSPRVAATANPVGGNPGGSLFFNDAAAGQPAEFYPPAFPAGGLAANYGGNLSFDLQITGMGTLSEVFVFIRGPQSTILTRVQPSPGGAFQTISFPLRARVGSDYSAQGGAFISPASEARWREVLAVADQIDVSFDVIEAAGDSYLLDNFLVTEPPPAPVGPGPVITPPIVTPPPARKCKPKKKGKKKPRKACKRKRKKKR